MNHPECGIPIAESITRRRLLLTGGMLTTAPFVLPGCTDRAYDDAANETWRSGETGISDFTAMQRELVRCATLAPSSHNTQCWKFRLQQRAIAILPDYSRRCPAVDPDDHHLFVSLGCATENLLQAALANGYSGETRFLAGAAPSIDIPLSPTQARASPLFDAIPRRQCTRAEYDGQPLTSDELRLLERAGSSEGVRLQMLTDKTAMEGALEYIVQANTVQMDDAAFIRELKSWIRFDDAEALRTRDGLFSRASGSMAVPRWLGSRLFSRFFTVAGENDKYTKHIRSSAGLAVFSAAAEGPAHWLEVGRCYQRFALQATALGIRNAFLNQPVEASTFRQQFASFLGLAGRRPDLVVRFGRGPYMPRSLRRPLEEVLL